MHTITKPSRSRNASDVTLRTDTTLDTAANAKGGCMEHGSVMSRKAVRIRSSALFLSESVSRLLYVIQSL